MTTLTKRPFVSVIMPVRDEADYITASLGAVLAQDYPSEHYEVVIVDGMSVDTTRAQIAELSTEPHPQVRVLDNPSQTAPYALNIGLADARGEVIVRVDGHCEIAEDYLTRCVQALHEHGAGCVGGPITTIGEGFVSRAIAVAMSSRFGVGGSAFRVGSQRVREVDSVAFPAWPRRVIDEVGLFDEELTRNQDDEYSYRLRKRGHRILLVPEIRSRYYSRASLRSLLRQYYQYGFWKIRVLQKHPRQMSLRQFVPPVFVAALVGASGLAWHPVGAAIFAWTLAAYLLAILVASSLLALQHGPRMLLVLPVAFTCLHFGYGTGFLHGLLRFWNRWRTPKHDHEP